MRLEIMVMDMVEDSQSIDAMPEEFAKAAGADSDTIYFDSTYTSSRTRTVRTPSCRPSTTWAGLATMYWMVSWGDWATRELMVLADSRYPRRFTEGFKRRIVQS